MESEDFVTMGLIRYRRHPSSYARESLEVEPL